MYNQILLPNISKITWFVFVLIIIWSLIWKGVALWKSAKNNDKAWFILLLIVNTVGILEIFYIYIFSKRNKQKEKEKNEQRNRSNTKRSIN